MEKKEKERVRRQYASAGSRSQKMVSFRLDLENAEWLEMHTNKGRYLNWLIEQDRKKEAGG